MLSEEAVELLEADVNRYVAMRDQEGKSFTRAPARDAWQRIEKAANALADELSTMLAFDVTWEQWEQVAALTPHADELKPQDMALFRLRLIAQIARGAARRADSTMAKTKPGSRARRVLADSVMYAVPAEHCRMVLELCFMLADESDRNVRPLLKKSR